MIKDRLRVVTRQGFGHMLKTNEIEWKGACKIEQNDFSGWESHVVRRGKPAR